MESAGTASYILNLGTKGEQSASNSNHFTPREKIPGTQWEVNLNSPAIQLVH
jgi:hypothetical protein